MSKTVVHLAAFYHPHVGGVEKHLQMLNHELRQRDYTLTVITQQHEDDLPRKETIDGVEVVRIPVSNTGSTGSFWQKTVYKFKLWTGIWQQLPKLRSADIIHVHDVFFWLLPFLPLLTKTKICITFHGYEGSKAPGKRQQFWHRLAEKLTDANLCIGGFHQKWYGVTPDATSFGAINVPAVAEIKPAQQLAYVGRLHPDTGIMAYLRALKLLKEQDKNYSLDVYGDGPLMKPAQQLVKKHNLSVKFHGFVEEAGDLVGQYQTAFVSRYLAILEALAVKTNVIAHYNNDIKHDYLYLSPFTDWIAITGTPRAIAKAVTEPQQVPPEAVEWAATQTWEKMADTYEQIWS